MFKNISFKTVREMIRSGAAVSLETIKQKEPFTQVGKSSSCCGVSAILYVGDISGRIYVKYIYR